MQELDFITIIPAVVWLVSAILHLSILCLGGGKVNEAAHSLYDSVYMTSLKDGSNPELMHKVTLELKYIIKLAISYINNNMLAKCMQEAYM